MAVLSFFGTYRSNKKSECSRFKNKTMSLQACCSPLLKESWTKNPGKRVLPFTSHIRLKASMAVEAAFALPLFLFLALALMMPMKMLDTHRKLQTETERICEELSLYGYLESDTGEPEGESEDVVLEAFYKEKIPFFPDIQAGITMKIGAKRRRWIGIDGKLTCKGDLSGGESGEEMVYIGAEMTRYHIDRNCHYISNQYLAVSIEEAKGMRDVDGHRFSACASCKSTIRLNGTVYITPGGRHYHGDTECRSMLSYVRKVPLSKVVHLGACSYCGDR